ncbi:hypothetical protein RR48_07032 [Papilio machaon]|uniref:U1-type domain-containing protein n=1 Tax=Papilio machaon TaxID=76193 RepID=A0A194R715_PAPMA|nr:hypothetical protein RR48_07032 [Papilio machaon]
MAYYEDIVYGVDGKVKCGLCNAGITNSNHSIEIHFNDKVHQDLYIKRLMIQNSISLNGNKKHCVLCNINLETNLQSHIGSFSHQNVAKKIKSLVEKDGSWLQLPHFISDSVAINCLICNKFIEYSLKSVEEHIKTIHHRRARAIVLQHYNGIFSIEGSNDDLWCKICRVCLENYIEVIFKHVDENKEHIKNLQKIKRLIEGQSIDIETFLTDPIEDKAYCNKCDTKVSCNVDNLERHIKGKMHNKEEKTNSN